MSPPSTTGGRYSDRLAVAAAAATTTIHGPDRPTTLPRRVVGLPSLRPGCAGPTLSRVHRACHACCCVAPGDARHGSTRAKPSVVSDVQRPRCSDALPVLAASRLAPSPCSFRCPLPPSPASPHEPRRTGSARLMQIPRRSRAFCAAPAPRQRLPQAGCRVIPRPAVGGVLGTPWCRASGFVTSHGDARREKRLSSAKARTK